MNFWKNFAIAFAIRGSEAVEKNRMSKEKFEKLIMSLPQQLIDQKRIEQEAQTLVGLMIPEPT